MIAAAFRSEGDAPGTADAGLSSHLQRILAAAQAKGLRQRDLASIARVRAESISRAKRRSNIDFKTLRALAAAVGLEIFLEPFGAAGHGQACAATQLATEPPRPGQRSTLADPQWGLAYSNAGAPAQALVRNALIKGSYDAILEAVMAHSLAGVEQEWQSLRGAPHDPGLSGLRLANVERMLRNIRTGIELAAAA